MADSKPSASQPDVKPTDKQENSPPQGDNTEDTEGKSIPYSRFKEVLEQKKLFESELKKIKGEIELTKKQKEEETLKAQGDYQALKQMKEAEARMAVETAFQHISKSYLTQLGAKHGIVDADAVDLFEAEFEFDDKFQIANRETIDKQFEEFKKKKPYLFASAEKKPVPTTDNQPTQKFSAHSEGKIPLSEILTQRMAK